MENQTENVAEASTAKQYIVVNLGHEQYGINIKYVDSIVRMQSITRVPKSQPFFTGVINLRGEIVPVMSLRRKFGLEDDEYTNASRIIILKPEPQAKIGFIVDSVKEVVTLEESQIESNSVDIEKNENAYVAAVGKYNNDIVSLLDIHEVIGDAENITA